MKLKNYFSTNYIFAAGCFLLAVGIPSDGFLRTFENIGLMLILCASFLNYKQFKWENLFLPVNRLLILLFFLCLFGYFYTDNIHELSRKSALKVLLALFAFAFSFSPKITDHVKRLTFLIFIVATASIATLSCIDYFIHFKEYNLLVQQSKPIPIIGGTMHIYFSLMMAWSVFLGIHLLNVNFKLVMNTMLDKIVFSALVVNVIALHVLSARTGLAAFYIVFVVLLFRYSIKKRRFKTLVGGLFMLLLFPLLMYLIVPSVKNRVNNTYEDLHRYYSGDYVGHFSISGRFETWKVAFHVFESHPIFGVGYGDLQQNMESQYLIDNTRLMREESLSNCHNQYIETLAAHGLIGFFVFLALLFLMFTEVAIMPRNNYLMLAFLTLFSVAFMVESLLEREAGLMLFLFFFYLIKNSAYDSEKNTSVAP